MQIDSQFVLTQTGTQTTSTDATLELDWATLIARELEQAKVYERNLATKAEPAPVEQRPAAPAPQLLLPEAEKDRDARQKEELKQQVWKEQFREEVKQTIDSAFDGAPQETLPLEADSLSLHAVFLNDFNTQMDAEVRALNAECVKMSEDLGAAARAAHKTLVGNLLSLEALPAPPALSSAPSPAASASVSSLVAPPTTAERGGLDDDDTADTRSMDDNTDNGFISADED